MKIIVDIPNYDGNSVDIIWQNGSKYKISVNDNNIAISANKNGLISFAKQMLYMAYNDLSQGCHVHYDSFFTNIDEIEYELTIEKM